MNTLSPIGSKFSTALVVATILATTLDAGLQDLSKIPGKWEPLQTIPRTGLPYKPPAWLTVAHVQTMHAQLAQVADVIRKIPALTNPIGFSVHPHRTVAFDRSWTAGHDGDLKWLFHGQLMLRGSPYILDAGKPMTTGNGELFTLIIDANDLQRLLGYQEWATDAEGAMFLARTPDDHVKGFPIYDGWAIVTRRTQPMTSPVSQERVVKWRIAEADANVARADELIKMLGANAADTLKDGRAQWQRVATDLRAQLAAMPPAARQAPAYALESVDPLNPLVSRETPDARAVVQANPQFFDQTRPGDIQVLAIRLDCSGCDNDFKLADKLRTELDWTALAAFTR